MVTTRSTSNPGCWVHTDTAPRSSTNQIVSGAGSGVAPLDHDPTRREPVGVDPTMHPPHQRGRLDLVRLDVVEQPLDRPAPEAVDDPLEVAPGRGEVVLAAVPRGRRPGLEHSAAFQVTQALHEQRPRDARAVARAMSLNRVLPSTSSRTIRGVQRSAMTSLRHRDRTVPPVIRHVTIVARRRRQG